MFFNRYQHIDLNNYHYTKEFKENDLSFVYAIGYSDEASLITKLSLSGQIVWQNKYYNNEAYSNDPFIKIIQLNVKDSYILVLLVGANLIGINSNNGEVLWSFSLLKINEGYIHLSELKNQPNFALSFITDKQQHLSIVDLNGNIQKTIIPYFEHPFIINDIATTTEEIFVAGHFKLSENDAENDIPTVISFNHALEFINGQIISGFTGQIYSIDVISSEEYIISGYDYKKHQVFFSNYPNNNESLSKFYYLLDCPQWSKIKLYNKDFYLLTYYNEGILHKFNNNHQTQWSKTLKTDQNSEMETMFTHFDLKNDTFNFYTYERTNGSLVARTNLNLDTCKTIVLENSITKILKSSLERVEPNLKETKIKLEKINFDFKTYDCEIRPICGDDNGGGIEEFPELNENTNLQSPNLLLSVAGSKGVDGSAVGNHLRWSFAGKLAELHLPKGNYTNQTFLFNKPDDFVKVFKTNYNPIITTLDFNLPQTFVENNQQLWIYDIDSKIFYVKFGNPSKYQTVLNTINPQSNPIGFLNNYGNELIDITCKNQLFFASKLYGQQLIQSSQLQLELLTVKENLPLSTRLLHTRKTFNQNNYNEKLFCHNGRSCRYKISHGIISSIDFEFYSDFVVQTPRENWQFLGKHALSTDNQTVYNRLEPQENLIHGKWLKYNDGETVNIENYKHRWDIVENDDDKHIKFAVSTFLDVSTNPNPLNPTAIVPSDDEALTEDNSLDLLELLNAGSIDFHIARMLGLGFLDIQSNLLTGDKYIYACEYTTLKNVNQPEESKTTIHLSLSLPTSITDERLPMPYEIDSIQPGILSIENGLYHSNLTDENGYTHEGDLRYVTLINKPLLQDFVEPAFFLTNSDLDYSTFTLPIFAGVEHKKDNQTNWQKPEIRHDNFYKNVFNDNIGSAESIPIFPNEEFNILLSHMHEASGMYHYSSYGVNIFSRATSSPIQISIETNLLPKNRLKPPTNVLAHLIQKESNLFFTTSLEQDRLDNNPYTDKTLVRLVFDYNHRHELNSYQVKDEHLALPINDLESTTIDGQPNPLFPDNKELFADQIEISFRNEVPQMVSGKIVSIQNHPTNPALLIINSGVFIYNSLPFPNPVDNTLTPQIDHAHINNFVGGVILNGNKQYIVQNIILNSPYPVFYVIDKDMADNPFYQMPTIESDGLFQLIENMQNSFSWNHPINEPIVQNPHTFLVNLNLGAIKREVITTLNDEGQIVKHLEKSRGFWANAIVEQENEVIEITENADGSQIPVYGFKGLYKLNFNATILPIHPQFNTNQLSVEWFKGVVRLRKSSQIALNGYRETLDVVKFEFNQSNHLILYVQDNQFPVDINEQSQYDAIHLGTQFVNYYPGYKVYLYRDTTLNLTENYTLPLHAEDTKLSIFGLKAINNQYLYKSKYSIPATMFGQLIQSPQQPQQPLGAKFATRPDFYGKATYSFKTSFGSNQSYQPHGLLFLRTNEEEIFNALYRPQTIIEIKEGLKPLGGNNEIWLQDRWNNFLDFDTLRDEIQYAEFPPDVENKYKFPIPNSEKFIEEINDFITWHNQKYNDNVSLIETITSLNQPLISSNVQTPLLAIDFIEEAIKNTYFPLTETPIIFKYIKFDNKPNPKKQKIKDNSGFMLSPDDTEFDMAPMAKRVSISNNQVYFTDFTLDGTSQNIYFYAVKEMNLQMQMGPLSQPIGPIKLINSNPPETPEIVSVIPVLENRVLGISASILFEINTYDKIQKIKKIELYRAYNMVDAQAIHSMILIKSINIDENLADLETWKIVDDFNDLNEIPFGDPICYRIVALREVEYEESDSVITEFAPSNPSRPLVSMVVENVTPESPVLTYFAESVSGNTLENIILSWNKTCYKGIYHLYKMTSQGNWKKIHELSSNDETMYLPLIETDLATSSLIITEDDQFIYHHFKVIAENTAGMFSQKENISTIYTPNTFNDIGGISNGDENDGMNIEGTFIIR